MTGKERVMRMFDGKLPDKVPHFELDFQIGEEAFGIDKPSYDEIKAAGNNVKPLLDRYFAFWDTVIEKYHWDAAFIPQSFGGHYENELVHMIKDRYGDKIAVYDYNGDGTFWMLPGTEMMEFTVRLFEDRQSLHEEAKRKRDASIAYAEKQVKNGVDFICINSDYGYNQGPFISPAMFEELVTPYLKEIVDAIHSMGKKAMLHSDGDLREILDQLVSTGLDGYQSVDPQGHMDIAEVRKQYPDLLLMGNVMCSMLQDENDEEIRRSVRYAFDSAKPGGRFIFSCSNCIFKGMPLASYEIMLDEYEKLAYY